MGHPMHEANPLAGGTIAGDVTLASALNLSVAAGLTASTTQTQGQQALTKTINEVATCANANDTVTLPTAVAGQIVIVINNGAQTLKVFPASGDTIDEGAANAAKTQAAGANFMYVAQNATNWNRINVTL